MGTRNLLRTRKNSSKKAAKKSKIMPRILAVIGYSFLSFICSEEILVRPNGLIDTKIDLQQIFLIQDKSTRIADGIIENKNSSFTEKASIVLNQGFRFIETTISNENFRKGMLVTGSISAFLFLGSISVNAKELPSGVNPNVIEKDYTQATSTFKKWYNEFSIHLPRYSEIFYLFGGIAVGLTVQIALDGLIGHNRHIIKHFCLRKTMKLKKALNQAETYLLVAMKNHHDTYELLRKIFRMLINYNLSVKNTCPEIATQYSDRLISLEKGLIKYRPRNPKG